MEIEGVNAAAVTPHHNGYQIDLGAALEVVDYLCAAGVQGITLLGSTGEFLHFGLEERARFIALAVKRSRVPVIAGVAHGSFEGCVKLANDAVRAGAAALLVMPPYFFRYSQPQVKEFFLRFRTQVYDGLPVILYNIPLFAAPIAVETAIELLETGLFAGIKDSSGSFEYFERLKALNDRRRFLLLVGNDAIFTRARRAGAHGVISGTACAAPELMLALDRAIAAGDEPLIARLEAHLREFISWIDRLPCPVVVKEAVAVRGLKIGPPSLPLPAAEEKLVAAFREWFAAWLKNVKSETTTFQPQ
jgi:dihydrodipicolinate synthase/N-acetylneuraminate lyase